MFSLLNLGAVYQTVRNSPHERRTAPKTDSFDLVEMINVTSKFNHLEPSETNIITKVISSVPHTGNSQIHAPGTD